MSKERVVRVGVVGCGYWGSKHVRVLQQSAAVSAVIVIDPRPARRDALAPVEAWGSRHAQLFQEDVADGSPWAPARPFDLVREGA
jgi:predicted dehydrogenase